VESGHGFPPSQLTSLEGPHEMRRVRDATRLCQLLLCLNKQQSRQRPPTLDGFALSPTVPFSRTVFVGFLDQPVNDMRRAFTCVPTFRSKRDAPRSDQSSIASGSRQSMSIVSYLQRNTLSNLFYGPQID
jgi:hypothetical protein